MRQNKGPVEDRADPHRPTPREKIRASARLTAAQVQQTSEGRTLTQVPQRALWRVEPTPTPSACAQREEHPAARVGLLSDRAHGGLSSSRPPRVHRLRRIESIPFRHNRDSVPRRSQGRKLPILRPRRLAHVSLLIQVVPLVHAVDATFAPVMTRLVRTQHRTKKRNPVEGKMYAFGSN
jgi:hypothetical protein